MDMLSDFSFTTKTGMLLNLKKLDVSEGRNSETIKFTFIPIDDENK